MNIAGRSALVALAIATLAACSPSGQPNETRFDGPGRPNVVFVLLDDLGYGDLGSYGNPLNRTPRLDRLAAEGTRFTRYYASGPVCTPTRVALLTGHHPSSLGIRRAIERESLRGIPLGVPTIAEWLRDAGYRTGHFGKWHVGDARPAHLPSGRGFDRSVTRDPGTGNEYLDPRLLVDGTTVVAAQGHMTERVTDHAVDFIERGGSGPFFLNVWYQAPHVPWQPSVRWAEQFPATPDGSYSALVAQVDEQIGRLLDALDRAGVSRDTLVFVASDNGATGMRKQAHLPLTNGGLRGFKAELYEGGIRVPLLARWPERIPAGVVNESVLTTVDLFPTLAGLLGLDASALGLNGRSLAREFQDGTVAARADETLFWETKDRNVSFTPASAGAFNAFAVRRGRWKLVQEDNAVNAAPMLFDLESDRAETTDLAVRHPEIAASLLDAYREWRIRVGALPYDVETPGGEAVREARGFRFDGGGGLTLARHELFDFHDGDFSARLDVRPELVGEPQVLADYRGSWRLVLTGDGLVRLTVFEQGTATETTLTGTTALAPDRTTAVAFTVFGWKNSPSLIRLYVAGRLEAESKEIRDVQPGAGSLRLGVGPDLAAPFRGSLGNLRFYVLSLSAAEVAASGS